MSERSQHRRWHNMNGMNRRRHDVNDDEYHSVHHTQCCHCMVECLRSGRKAHLDAARHPSRSGRKAYPDHRTSSTLGRKAYPGDETWQLVERVIGRPRSAWFACFALRGISAQGEVTGPCPPQSIHDAYLLDRSTTTPDGRIIYTMYSEHYHLKHDRKTCR